MNEYENSTMDIDFFPFMTNLNYKLIKTKGQLNGTRYEYNTRRNAKATSIGKNKQSPIK